MANENKDSGVGVRGVMGVWKGVASEDASTVTDVKVIKC